MPRACEAIDTTGAGDAFNGALPRRLPARTAMPFA
jgi:sugar/nucleoside kinase (ribokinase family)